MGNKHATRVIKKNHHFPIFHLHIPLLKLNSEYFLHNSAFTFTHVAKNSQLWLSSARFPVSLDFRDYYERCSIKFNKSRQSYRMQFSQGLRSENIFHLVQPAITLLLSSDFTFPRNFDH